MGEILNEYKNRVTEAKVIPSSGGVFEVQVNGTMVFSKKDEGDRFPDPGEILQRMTQIAAR
ncbi:SelT/SelW/SelH family protein [Sulfobacillus sp. DSM 109850]|uniref:SelT/SelW/SelH family protein n=1 Tax=Sulfobacillus harzensis TaxID=2729629 RepID=A0A7Y0L663_9FIRM|nr:SelT/SelW/SelH family protein [Sulfobacillus harzensis]